VPWLADEIDTLRGAIGEALAMELEERLEPPGEPSAEADRRRYQLRVLGMIRDQLPLTQRVWSRSSATRGRSQAIWRGAARITSAVVVVGPARAMLVLIRGAARNVADGLGEALHGPDGVASPDRRSAGYLVHSPELGRLTPAVATRLRDLAEAARAFTETYVAAVAVHRYSFDPAHYEAFSDELN
jgi:hypothetical protein